MFDDTRGYICRKSAPASAAVDPATRRPGRGPAEALATWRDPPAAGGATPRHLRQWRSIPKLLISGDFW